MDIVQLKAQLKTLLISDLEKGIDLFKTKISNASKLFNEAILIQSRLDQINKDASRNVVTFQQKNIVLNKIRGAYLNLVDQITVEDLKDTKVAPPTTPTLTYEDAFYQQDCKSFLEQFNAELSVVQNSFSNTYDDLGQLQIDFGQMFIAVGKVMESMKPEPGKESEFNQRFEIALKKSARKLQLFETRLQPAIDKANSENQALLKHYQKLIYYLDFPNPSLQSGACQSAMKQQLSVLDTLKSKSEKLVQSLLFTDELEKMAYLFKVNETLEKAFLETLDSLKELRNNTDLLCKQANILSLELKISVEEMSL